MSQIQVRSRVHVRGDRAGDPLDGLVNMFDLGIVLAVAFLIAALQAHGLERVLTQKSTLSGKPHTVTIKPNQETVPLKPTKTKVTVKGGAPVGEVYRLPNGSLVYVRSK
jgi:hypothetical protein